MSLTKKQKLALLEWKLRNIFRKPYYALVRKPYRKIQQIFGQVDFVPSGHFYSPIPSAQDVSERVANLSYNPESIAGIDLRLDAQRSIMREFSEFYKSMPFTQQGTHNLRYRLDNGYYAQGDGVILYCFMRYLNPKNIIEIGSGYSSALMYDVRELSGGGKYYPYRALS